MNKIFLIGNLTGDPELRTTPSGINVCTMNIAVNRRFSSSREDRQADFFRITAWRQLGETCSRYLSKGRKVAVVGELAARTYEAKDGTTRVSLEVTADEVEFLSPRDPNSYHGDNQGYQSNRGYQSNQGYNRGYQQNNPESQGTPLNYAAPAKDSWQGGSQNSSGSAQGTDLNQNDNPLDGFTDVSDSDLPF